MNEFSYAQALSSGIEPMNYRIDLLDAIGAGNFEGVLDALVWSQKEPSLMALITLDGGRKVKVLGFQRHSRKDLPEYLGLRELEPGAGIHLLVEVGVRGGLRPTVTRRGERPMP